MNAQEQVTLTGTLPKSYPVGAKKALKNMQGFYGQQEGRRIFVQKALEQGSGTTFHDKIASTYRTGAKL